MGRKRQDGVGAAARRDVGAWFDSHAPDISRYLSRRLGADAAQDALSEVFERALATYPRIAERDAEPRPWLFGIAANVIHEQRRVQERQLRLIERLAAANGSAGGPAGDAAQSLDVCVAAALRSLPDQQRETLLLIAWGELSYEECATAMQVPVGTVRSRISRARSHLQAMAPKDFMKGQHVS